MIIKRTLGFYPGSFSPFHKGHMDIVNQARSVFEEVVVAKGINPEKGVVRDDKYPLPEKYLKGLGIKIASYDTLLIDVIKRWEITHNVTLVRGLRNGADLEYEQNIVAFLKGMYPEIKVVAFYCDPNFRHISSSALRGIEKFSKAEFNKYVILDQ